MEQLVVVIFIIGTILLAEKTGQPIYNIISAGFCFYLAFTIHVPFLMIVLIVMALFQLIYIFDKFRN